MNPKFRFLYLFLVTALLLTSSCDVYDWNQNNNYRNRLIASNDITQENRSVSGFSKVKVCCSIQVDIHPSDSYSVAVSGPDNVLEVLLTEVSGAELQIGFENGANVDMRGQRIQIDLGMPTLAGIRSSSSSNVQTSGDFSGTDLQLSASSSGHVSVAGFNGNDAQLSASSSGKIDLNFRGSDIKAESSSSGHIRLSGEAQSIKASASSSGRIIAADCQVKNADASVSSSGRVELHVLDRLVGNARSSGDIIYRGDPEFLDSDSASGGKIKKMD